MDLKVKLGDVFIATGHFSYGFRIDEILSHHVDNDGYMLMNVTMYSVETTPPKSRREKAQKRLRVITKDLIRNVEPQEYGYPGETGLLPMYYKRFIEDNEQLCLF